MSVPLRMLIVEDSDDDAQLLLAELRGAGYDPIAERVDTPAALELALDNPDWDVLVTDYTMPHLSAQAVFSAVRKRGLDLPVLVVSGTIRDDAAVALIYAGARDYILKDDLGRLVLTIDRELQGAPDRRARRERQKER